MLVARGQPPPGFSEVKLDVNAGGLYLAPFLRITFGRIGYWGLVIRSQWLVTGDVLQMTSLGLEFLLP